jgi:hypothetical protein
MRKPIPGFLLVLMVALSASASAQDPPPLNQPRPIEAGNSLWAEELTWMEIRDAVAAGTTTIIIGTGGIEQNGPYVAVGKHNYCWKPCCSTSQGRSATR